ncbi:cytochrome o ubiquinol oxidase subunit IV [Roseateles sp. BYS180W]|uniref:Cytochrome bo(3) ubiquinol oxidase subunit 4 n=1 Tax=Roseateles rivi TaxID=3299028 RepID=A0ABW7FRJ4_9BURK
MAAQHNTHGHDDGHHDDPLDGYHATVKGYVVGFLLSAILTIIPFWLVMAKVLPPEATKLVILVFAAVQIVVQMVYFLHLDGKMEGGWTLLSTIFTVIFVAIILAGSIWVMYHMNTNMMPTHDMRAMP